MNTKQWDADIAKSIKPIIHRTVAELIEEYREEERDKSPLFSYQMQ